MQQPNQDQIDYQVLTNSLNQPNPMSDTTSLYADAMREEKITNILSQINPDNLLADIEYRIRGYKKNTITLEWEKINKKSPDINEKLVANFMSYLGSVLNQNTSMSNFSGGEINTLMEHLIDFIADDLTSNDEHYGLVGNYQEMSRIGNIITMTVFAVLKRSQNGMEARRVFASLRISESLTQSPQNKGWSDALKFWK